MSAVAARFGGLSEQWRANPRLRWGVLAIGLILFVYACQVLADWRRQLHDDYQARTVQLYKMTALAGEEHWIARAREVQALEKALQAEVPASATIGLAQAEMQTFVRQLMNAYGRRLSSDMRAPAQVAGFPGVWRVPVTLRGQVSQVQLLEILRRVEGSDRLMVVDEFSLRFERGTPSFSLTFSGFFRIGGAAQPGREAADGAG